MRNSFGFTQSLMAILILLFVTSASNAQRGSNITWPKDLDLTPADKQAIITLAKRMGIENPKRVSLGKGLPVACLFLHVESPVTQSGQLRTWIVLTLQREDWSRTGCLLIPRGSTPLQSGRWLAGSSGSLLTLRQWSIQEDGWHVDVQFDPPVSYKDAELIVLAIRHGRLLNRLPPSAMDAEKSICKIPNINVDTIQRIHMDPRDPGAYWVYTRSGATNVLLTVKIVEGKVELHECGELMS